jgi:hypothetical protein
MFVNAAFPSITSAQVVAAFLIFGAIFLAISISRAERKYEQKKKVLNTLRIKLKAEIMEVSLLVSQRCPNNRDAHAAVIAASQCLVYQQNAASEYDLPPLITERYMTGFACLEQAREIAGKSS